MRTIFPHNGSFIQIKYVIGDPVLLSRHEPKEFPKPSLPPDACHVRGTICNERSRQLASNFLPLKLTTQTNKHSINLIM